MKDTWLRSLRKIGQCWKPENIDGGYNGRVSLAEAFARSLNVATVRLGMEVGLPSVAAARELGIDAPLQETPSLILGTSEISLLDLTGAYASIRAGVVPVEPYGIRTFEAANGQPFAIGPRVQPSLPIPDVHEPLLQMLQLVVERGTAQPAKLDRFAAGKTGTSQNHRDAWFIGFDQNHTVGVWVGNDDGSPMDKVTGGQLFAVIWQRFMMEAGGARKLSSHQRAREVPWCKMHLSNATSRLARNPTAHSGHLTAPSNLIQGQDESANGNEEKDLCGTLRAVGPRRLASLVCSSSRTT